MWKGCFGYPGGADCIKSKNCTALTTFKQVMNGSFTEFEIYGSSVPTNGYVAIGISTDDRMVSIIKINSNFELNSFKSCLKWFYPFKTKLTI